MRRAHNGGFLMDGDTFVGVNLGADFTAEHEWGISELRDMFGMKDNKIGIDKRTATTVPKECVRFIKSKKFSLLICDHRLSSELYGMTKWIESDEFKKGLEKGQIGSLELAIYKPYRSDQEPQTLATSWDKGSFGILVTAEYSDTLEILYNAILHKDVAIWLGGGHVFENAGLVVAIRSLCPKDGVKQMKEADEDAIKLEKADKKTGIKEKLRKAGKRYFACSPKWIFDSRKDESKHPVIYWLNPCDQHNTNYGWFTVEQLEEWAEDKGPIPMNEEQLEKRHSRV